MYKLRVGMREAKENFSRLVNEVKKGTEIILTERGKPVARLAPINEESLSLASRLSKLEHAGMLEPANRAGLKLPSPLPLCGEKAQAFLQEDRNR
ncbi:MAG: type II toxin-antitoxin system prevent-host-death family antitoxin [Clostridium sp.]|nr:type II toxin-antitoxin system prevent-host-death family antitoxin [Clostridium sp.]